MLQAIVYDAVGTLIHVKPSVAALYADVGRRFGSRLEADEIRRRFSAAFARQERLDEDADWRTDETRERQRWRDIVADVLDDAIDPAGCFETLFDVFGKVDSWACDPEAAEVVAKWHERGCRQALASNFDRRLRGIIDAMPSLRSLTPIVVSSEIGWRKPATQFFTHLAEALQLPPSTILYVGDDRDNDFDGARRAGMRALLLDPRRKHLDVGTERLERLGDLLLV